MSNSTTTSSGPGVALLFEDADLSAHLREALIEAGARIVHEGPATKATREDLAGNGADVVVVNLDAKVEDHLDELYDIFDEDRQRVVFNDAAASSGLSGWDQARWARHLAAKLMDAHDVDPPRPAEARPVEAHPTELALPEGDMPEAPAEPDEPVAEPMQASTGEEATDGADLTAELEALLAEDGDLLGMSDEAAAEPAGIDTSDIDMDLSLDEGDIEGSDLDAINAIPDAAVAPLDSPTPHAPASDEHVTHDKGPESLASDDDIAFEETLRQFDQVLAESETGDDDSEDQSSSADALFMKDDPGALSLADDAPAEGTPDAENESPAPAPTPAPAAVNTASPYSLVDMDEDAPEAAPAAEAETVQAPEAPDWGLVDFEADDTSDDSPSSSKGVDIIDQNASGGEISDPSEFGIEKLTASEYLSPEDETDGATTDVEIGIEKMSPSEYLTPEGGDNGAAADVEPTFSLELEPMSDAVAPQMVDEAHAGPGIDANLDSGIRHAVIIAAGSSEEARQNIRDFLGEINKMPKGVMIAVLHQESGSDPQELAVQLGLTNTVLTFRVAGDGQSKVRHGEVIVVPPGKQAALSSSGQMQLMDAAGQALANPSIDLTMTLVAQEMGENVTAIVMAGDAIDALAGAQAVSDRGGRVWAVDPADCNENTMVSVICEEQLAQVTGTPKELAARMIEELS